MASLEDATHGPAFAAARDGGGPVIVDFFTKSCILCKRVEPMIAAVAAESDAVTAFKIDAEENVEIAARYEIRGVPSVLLFHGGELVDRKVGFVTAGELRKWVAPYLDS